MGSENNSKDQPSTTVFPKEALRQAKTFRDPVWGDIILTQLEVMIIDTLTFQRLRKIKQLGTTYLVYPGAHHTRFEHSLGTLYTAQKIINAINSNSFQNDNFENPASQSYKPIIEDVWIFLIRITALIHDLAHIPFGHTIEDEGNIYDSYNHDDVPTTVRKDEDFAEIIQNINSINKKIGDHKSQWTDDQRTAFLLGQTSELFVTFTEYFKSKVKSGKQSELVSFINDKFREDNKNSSQTSVDEINSAADKLCKILAAILTSIEKHDISILSTKLSMPKFSIPGFVCDIVGNTLCADLLDYLKRDLFFTGLHSQYDERILNYLDIGDYDGSKRVILRLFKPSSGDLRRDILSEFINLLRLRYSLAEKVYEHHAKKVTSSMLLSAVYEFNYQRSSSRTNKLQDDLDAVNLIKRNMGDEELLVMLSKNSNNRCTKLINDLRARKLFKPVYEFEFDNNAQNGQFQDEFYLKDNIVSIFQDPFMRNLLERYLEGLIGEEGTVSVYCPPKPAEVGIKPLKTIVQIGQHPSTKNIGPFDSVITDITIKYEVESSIQEKYNKLWRFHVFVSRDVSQYKILKVIDALTSIIKIPNECKSSSVKALNKYSLPQLMLKACKFEKKYMQTHLDETPLDDHMIEQIIENYVDPKPGLREISPEVSARPSNTAFNYNKYEELRNSRKSGKNSTV